MVASWYILTSFGGEPVGLILLPPNVYILWSLFTKKHNPYTLLSLTACTTALIASCHEDYGCLDINLLAIIILTPPIYILFTAWFPP
ncbi:hypothetical protein P0Y35_03825 [Kiritimatiellaeota bacterium B1221]|nr:hypothetical protein [Kiritimatiellaeota bacterium B1221]